MIKIILKAVILVILSTTIVQANVKVLKCEVINDKYDFYKIDTSWFKSPQFYTRQQGVWIKYEESLYKNDLGSSCKLIKKTCSKAKQE